MWRRRRKVLRFFVLVNDFELIWHSQCNHKKRKLTDNYNNQYATQHSTIQSATCIVSTSLYGSVDRRRSTHKVSIQPEEEWKRGWCAMVNVKLQHPWINTNEQTIKPLREYIHFACEFFYFGFILSVCVCVRVFNVLVLFCRFHCWRYSLAAPHKLKQ